MGMFLEGVILEETKKTMVLVTWHKERWGKEEIQLDIGYYNRQFDS